MRNGDKKCLDTACGPAVPDHARWASLILSERIERERTVIARQLKSSRAFASASAILLAFFPAPCALSGRPPPFPPTIGATC